jgi:hypothetical protein
VDFASSALKLARAREQLASLQAEVDAFLAAGPLRLAPVSTPNEIVFVARFDCEMSPEWGLNAAEIVYHTRSALDHLVFQASGQQPRTQFPIATTPRAFDEAPAQWLAGVPPVFRDLFRGAQPFHAVDPVTHPFAALNRMSNRDKHRELTPAVLNLRKWSCEIDIVGVSRQRLDVDLGRERIVRNGDRIFGIGIKAFDADGNETAPGDVLQPPSGLTVPFQAGFISESGESTTLTKLADATSRAADLLRACEEHA